MFSDPVVGDHFFGRRDIIDLLVKRATALKSGYRQNVALIGHQQLGKTSVLRHFLHTFRDPDILTIYVEIRLQALDFFVDQFMRSVLYQVLVMSGQTVEPLETLQGLSARAATIIPKTVARIGEITACLKQRRAEESYAKLFELTSIVKQETGKHCIVVLDEFHRLGEFGVKNAFADFGKRIMVQKDTMYLLSSSSFSASRKILAEKLSLLFGNFERVYLEPFDFETSFEFLEKKLSPVRVPRTLKYFLVAFTDGHPFFMDTIAGRLKELASVKEEAQLSTTTTAEALRKLLFESQGVLNQFFQKLISPWTGPTSRGCHLLVLAQLANGNNKLKELSASVNRSQAEVSQHLNELMEYELIIKTGVFYRFHNKLFKFWLKEVYQKKELSLLGTQGKADGFARRIHELAGEYESLLRMDAADRVHGLLGSFKDEIIEFGEKKRKLPHFTEILEREGDGQNLHGRSRELIAKGHGRCWVCKITEEKATEKEVLSLVAGSEAEKLSSPTRVLIAFKGLDDNAKLLAKEKKVLTLGLSKLNLLMDIYDKPPIIFSEPG